MLLDVVGICGEILGQGGHAHDIIHLEIPAMLSLLRVDNFPEQVLDLEQTCAAWLGSPGGMPIL